MKMNRNLCVVNPKPYNNSNSSSSNNSNKNNDNNNNKLTTIIILIIIIARKRIIIIIIIIIGFNQTEGPRVFGRVFPMVSGWVCRCLRTPDPRNWAIKGSGFRVLGIGFRAQAFEFSVYSKSDKGLCRAQGCSRV